MLESGLTEYRSTGATVWVPMYSSYLADAYAELGHLDDARRYIEEALTAVELTGERWWQAEAHRVAGELVLKSPERDTVKAEVSLSRALAVSRHGSRFPRTCGCANGTSNTGSPGRPPLHQR
jgi:predicted ATPase